MQTNKLIFRPDNFDDTVATISNNVVVKQTMKYCGTTSLGGIYIPDSQEEFEKKYDIGEVVAIGPEVKTIKVGDCIIYQKSTGFRLPDAINVSHSDPTYRVIQESPGHVMCILPGDVEPGE